MPDDKESYLVTHFVSNDVLAAQISLLQASVDSLSGAISKLPNEQTLKALFEIRDHRIESLTRDVQVLSDALTSEREAREEGDQQIRKDSESAKRYALTTSLTVAMLVIAALTLSLRFLTG